MFDCLSVCLSLCIFVYLSVSLVQSYRAISFPVLLYHTLLNFVFPCKYLIIPYYTLTLICSAFRYPSCITLIFCTLFYSTLLHCILLHSALIYFTLFFCTLSYSTPLHCSLLFSTLFSSSTVL